MTSLERQSPQSPGAMSPSSTPTPDSGFEERWATWQTRGRAHDVRTRVRMIAAITFVSLSAAGWLAWAVLRADFFTVVHQ